MQLSTGYPKALLFTAFCAFVVAIISEIAKIISNQAERDRSAGAKSWRVDLIARIDSLMPATLISFGVTALIFMMAFDD